MRETRLLSDDDFAQLLQQKSVAPVVTRLRQADVYAALEPSDPESLSRHIEEATVRAVRRLAAASPDPLAAELLLATYDFQQVNQYVKTRLTDREFLPSELSRLTEEDLVEAWNDSVDAPRVWADAMQDARRAAADAPDTDAAVDLMLDRAELMTLEHRSRRIDSRQIGEWCDQYGRERTRLALVRARMAGEDPERLRRLGRELVGGDELDEIAEAPVERIIKGLADAAQSGEDSGQALSRFALGIDNRMTDRLSEAKNVAFGPERIFGFAWALLIERLNLKLIVETILLQARAEETSWRLRKSYA